MQRMIYRLIPAILFAILLCTSCTIQKRVHTGGYYIQWHKHHPQASGHRKKTKREPVAEVDSVAVKPVEDTLTEPEIAQEPLADTVVRPVPDQPEKAETAAKKRRRPFEPVGVLSAKLLALPVLAGILKDNSPTHAQDYMLGIAFLFFLSICFFLGMLSMIYYLRDPKAYRFNIWAILAILVPLFFFVALLLDYAALF
jgi:hypothetical protein